MVSGRKVTTSGTKVMSSASPTMMRKNGRVARAIRPIRSPVIPWITNRLKPTGGVIWAISTTTTRNTPNQILSNPAACTRGRVIGRVMTMLDMPSSTQPRIA